MFTIMFGIQWLASCSCESLGSVVHVDKGLPEFGRTIASFLRNTIFHMCFTYLCGMKPMNCHKSILCLQIK